MKLCFTGHRKVEGLYPPHGRWNGILNKMSDIVFQATKVGYTEFISGGAVGFDQVAAKAVIVVKAFGTPITLTMALPFKGFDAKWPQASREELALLMAGADSTIYVSEPGYAAWKLMKRNEYMVNNANSVMALYLDNTSGGTLNCMNYAMKNSRPILVLNPITLKTHTLKWNGTKWERG